MKAIILAAGVGSRISKHINEKPKCMVDIGGTTLIDYTISLLKEKGIKEITLVLGYKADYIKKNIKDKDINIVYNPFFDITNGIVSMWFAKEYIDENEKLLIMSGDVYVVPEIIDELLKVQKSPVLLTDSSRILEADFRFNFGEDKILRKYGKDLTQDETTGECVGIGVLDVDFVKTYKEHMIEMINSQKHGVWWESVMYDMIPEKNIYLHDVKGMFWSEVDIIEDYHRILQYRKGHNLF